MGAELLCNVWQIKDNVGLYLFGGQNYQASEGVIAPEVPGGFNLYMLAEILGDQQLFPKFSDQVHEVNGLYGAVMRHAGPLEDSRALHRDLDQEAKEEVYRLLHGDNIGSDLFAEMKESGSGWIQSKLAVLMGNVPNEVILKYLQKTLAYQALASRSHNNLEEQLTRFEGVSAEMDKFQELLVEKISPVLHKIAAKNQVQLLEPGLVGFQRARKLGEYIDGAIAMIPPFCRRRDDIKRVLSLESNNGIYLQDDLHGLEYSLK